MLNWCIRSLCWMLFSIFQKQKRLFLTNDNSKSYLQYFFAQIIQWNICDSKQNRVHWENKKQQGKESLTMQWILNNITSFDHIFLHFVDSFNFQNSLMLTVEKPDASLCSTEERRENTNQSTKHISVSTSLISMCCIQNFIWPVSNHILL